MYNAPADDERRFGSGTLGDGGSSVLVGIIDVGGFDFAHPDLLDDEGKTRLLAIWDQGGDGRLSPQAFGYGSEILKEHMDAAIEAAPRVGAPATALEPQSQMQDGSHGTHVASIAAGNLGIARKAMIAAVLIDLPEEDLDRRLSFYDSTRIAHAVSYLLALASKLGDIPVSLNISLGTNGHAHDGSSAVSRGIDAALTRPGRSVCVAAGNAGQEGPEEEGDIGFVMGRIHTSGRIPARGLDADIDWQVVGNGLVDISENEFEVWYGPQDRFGVSLRTPAGHWIGPVEPGEYIENQQLSDGSFASIYNENYYPANGSNYITLYLSPLLSNAGVVGVPAGTWTVRLHGRDIRDGSYHGWIERDDPRRIGRIGPREAWRFPSFFSGGSNVDRNSISSLACGQLVVAVANLDGGRQKINISSSQGPTRDGRHKPEIAASGTAVVAARGFAGDDLWAGKTGTSMASPYVAGVCALMLAVEPKLTAAQIQGILKRTARPLPNNDFVWRDDSGFGKIDPEACLREASIVNDREDITDET